jgi:hypothetical protein
MSHCVRLRQCVATLTDGGPWLGADQFLDRVLKCFSCQRVEVNREILRCSDCYSGEFCTAFLHS